MMSFSIWRGLLLVGSLAGLLALSVACGGKDDENKDTATAAASEQQDLVSEEPDVADDSDRSGSEALASLSPFGDMFKGGDDDAPAATTSAKPTKDDERYAKEICVAGAKMFAAIEKASKDLEEQDMDSEEDLGAAFEAIFALMGEPLADFFEGFADAHPPKDLAEWHKETAKVMRATAKTLRDGDFSALMMIDETALPEPPAEAAARVEKAVAQVKECRELAEFAETSEDFFGGE
jgi:hypothetical protein